MEHVAVPVGRLRRHAGPHGRVAEQGWGPDILPSRLQTSLQPVVAKQAPGSSGHRRHSPNEQEVSPE